MVTDTFTPARRLQNPPLLVAIEGPPGSGKTTSALHIARGLGDVERSRIALIDLECGASDLAAGHHEFDQLVLPPTATPDTIVEQARAAQAAGYDALIVDSLSSPWNALLDRKSRLERAMSGVAAWWRICDEWHRLVHGLSLAIPVIVTLRSRLEYPAAGTDDGSPLAPVSRGPVVHDSTLYAATVHLALTAQRDAYVLKDRTAALGHGPWNLHAPGFSALLRQWRASGDPRPSGARIETRRAIELELQQLRATGDKSAPRAARTYARRTNEIIAEEALAQRFLEALRLQRTQADDSASAASSERSAA